MPVVCVCLSTERVPVCNPHCRQAGVWRLTEMPSCYRPQTKFEKVMFLQVSVCPQGGGMHGGGRCVWQGRCAWWGACMAGAMHGGGVHGEGHVWQGVWGDMCGGGCVEGMHGGGGREACMAGWGSAW